MPPAALANDMMICYAPTDLHTENVTVMDMLCASVCITSMICLMFEQKGIWGHRAMDELMHGNAHRMAARRNATSFPLPRHDLLKQLTDGAKMEEPGRSASLPRTGQELTHVVYSFETSNTHGGADVNMARFIHQAMVRRSVAVKLIETMMKKEATQHINT